MTIRVFWAVFSSQYVRVWRRYMTSNEMPTWKSEVCVAYSTIWYLVMFGVCMIDVHNDDMFWKKNLVHLWFFVAICLWFATASTIFPNHIFLSSFYFFFIFDSLFLVDCCWYTSLIVFVCRCCLLHWYFVSWINACNNITSKQNIRVAT